jgi:hypothetical protein
MREWDVQHLLQPDPPATNIPATPGPGPRTAMARATAPLATPGPGPRTAAARPTAPLAVHFTPPVAARPPALSSVPSFAALNKDSDSDTDTGRKATVTMKGKQKEKKVDDTLSDDDSEITEIRRPIPKTPKTATKQPKKVRAKVMTERTDAEDEEDEDENVVRKPTGKKVRAKVMTERTDAEDEEDEDEENVVRKRTGTVIVSRPRASKPRPLPVGTGEYHDPPCGKCVELRRECEKEAGGRACVSCKGKKHRCDFSSRQIKRQLLSKAAIDSGEEEAVAATTSRPTRPAAGRAKTAIQQEAATAPAPTPRTRNKAKPAASPQIEGKSKSFRITNC